MVTMRRNFLGLPPELSGLGSSRYVILPVPYEETVTYGEGTEFGPNAILNARRRLNSMMMNWDWRLAQPASTLHCRSRSRAQVQRHRTN